MNARLIATLSALSLGALAGAGANAEEATPQLAWQQPGYVMEVVIVTAPRLETQAVETTAADGALAWQEPGYVEEVVVVKASRRDVLTAAARRMAPAASSRQHPFMGTTAN